MHLIIGLGNPGTKYKKTRHNAGFLVIENLAMRVDCNQPLLKKCNALIAKTDIGGTDVLLAQPQTFMNESGKAVQALAHYYKINPKNILIIYDDIDLPLGKIRIREKGSAGGHKGLQSIIDYLNTNEFSRIKIGIGPQPENIPSEKYVLQNFKRNEWKIMQEDMIPKTIEAIECFLKNGIDKTMCEYNC
ncbi:aminoacyl-tRNA hydrolase [Patescibacteria group bacterium]|nr:aminoacyl-tRNA hydrolase [Patescibacteria group bacterium]MBU4511875.1 aminoacyl-tRNA hydrolase [Patescibacteria group bacterium]